MDFQLSFKVNEHIYLRDPESSELGKQIVKNAIDLIYELGFEHFTFKKLATKMSTTEASIYRYFENKHRLLLYILNWYWSYMEFLVDFTIQNIQDPKEKLTKIITLFTQSLPESVGKLDYNKSFLNQIVLSESSKVYLIKEVKEINSFQVFKPYKDLCNKISEVMLSLNPTYAYARSLSSTLIETAHSQQYFSKNLPRLTDVANQKEEEFVFNFLSQLVFSALKPV
ncbi:MAG: TetR/AcrR family transcriptional regulator [Cytophagia bacterium]|nr:TetR/AcrR family transcriptional regulator [Cytophagia bacterium]